MKLIGSLLRLVLRLVVVPVKLALAVVGITARTSFRLGRLPARATRRSLRLVGLKAGVALVVGVVLGLVLAPESGKQLRARLAVLAGRRGGESDEDLADKVGFELAHAPRTWHLDQPDVSVQAGRVTLTGLVPAAEARDELARVAAAIPGVAGVDNQIVVDVVAEAPVS